MTKAVERGAAALAQVLIAGGIVAGGAGLGVGLQQAGVLGGGDETVEVSLDAVSTYSCPDGSAVGELHRGDRILATGRGDDGDWIELRDPRDLSARVWIAERYLVPDADLSDLDVRECAPNEEVAEPATTTTLPGALPPEATTTTRRGGSFPAPGPGPGPAPDTAGPSIGSVSASPSLIRTSGGACNDITSLVSVSASDPSGVQSTSVGWAVPGFGSGAGALQPDGRFKVGPVPGPASNLPPDTPVTLTITARDNAGNQSQITNTSALRVSRCQ